jgi:tRNA (guanine-N7-)-methyltransferase
LKNVRLFDDDAVNLLDWLPEASSIWPISSIPIPGRRARHWKRRFINQQNLSRYAG